MEQNCLFPPDPRPPVMILGRFLSQLYSSLVETVEGKQGRGVRGGPRRAAGWEAEGEEMEGGCVGREKRREEEAIDHQM